MSMATPLRYCRLPVTRSLAPAPTRMLITVRSEGTVTSAPSRKLMWSTEVGTVPELQFAASVILPPLDPVHVRVAARDNTSRADSPIVNNRTADMD